MSESKQSGGAADRQPALLFDLDGTLVDSVYQHVLAWSTALEEAGIQLAVWRIHRYGREELERAGAFRVYEDPADLRAHTDELGIRFRKG